MVVRFISLTFISMYLLILYYQDSLIVTYSRKKIIIMLSFEFHIHVRSEYNFSPIISQAEGKASVIQGGPRESQNLCLEWDLKLFGTFSLDFNSNPRLSCSYTSIFASANEASLFFRSTFLKFILSNTLYNYNNYYY